MLVEALQHQNEVVGYSANYCDEWLCLCEYTSRDRILMIVIAFTDVSFCVPQAYWQKTKILHERTLRVISALLLSLMILILDLTDMQNFKITNSINIQYK